MFAYRRSGFTLLEICLALLIGALLILLAIPSIGGMLAEQRLKQSFERFDHLVAAARRQSVTGQRTCSLAWQKNGIVLQSADQPTGQPDDSDAARLDFQAGESFQLLRPAALAPDAPPEWTFWSNGLCEPVQIAFHGKAGSWLVRYDPLTARGTFLQSELP